MDRGAKELAFSANMWICLGVIPEFFSKILQICSVFDDKCLFDNISRGP